MRAIYIYIYKLELLTLVPLLGPIGGGLGAAFGFSPSVVTVAEVGGGAPSSAARTASLPERELLSRGKKDTTLLEEELAAVDPTPELIRKLEAAEAMFMEAITDRRMANLSEYTKKKLWKSEKRMKSFSLCWRQNCTWLEGRGSGVDQRRDATSAHYPTMCGQSSLGLIYVPSS